jgi:hypothetical protein
LLDYALLECRHCCGQPILPNLFLSVAFSSVSFADADDMMNVVLCEVVVERIFGVGEKKRGA